MINLKKHDIVADAVLEVLQQEALKGNQHKIDANHNNKIDGEDFKILRGKKKVEEELKGNQDKIDANHNGKIDGEDFKLLRTKKKMKEEAGRTEDCLDGKPKAKKGDDVGPGSDGKSSKVKLKAEEYTLKQMKERMEEPILDELINEVMSKDASAGDYIHDFIHSDNPKFAGKSKAKRKEMALAAYYSKKNEEAVNEGLKDLAKKSFKALTGGSDKDHLDRLKKDMYGDSEVKYAAKTLVKHAKDPLGLKKEEVVAEGAGYTVDDEIQHWKDMALHWARMGDEKSMLKSKANSKAAEQKKKDTGAADKQQGVAEGWDDMVKDAKEKVKSGPQPNGGSGKKQGSAYGGSKQKDKPEQEVKEAKDPTMDAGCGSAPNFATDATKPMQAAQTMAKKSLARMRSDMMAKSGK